MMNTDSIASQLFIVTSRSQRLKKALDTRHGASGACSRRHEKSNNNQMGQRWTAAAERRVAEGAADASDSDSAWAHGSRMMPAWLACRASLPPLAAHPRRRAKAWYDRGQRTTNRPVSTGDQIAIGNYQGEFNAPTMVWIAAWPVVPRRHRPQPRRSPFRPAVRPPPATGLSWLVLRFFTLRRRLCNYKPDALGGLSNFNRFYAKTKD